jgi:single-strand DNA-binding protein
MTDTDTLTVTGLVSTIPRHLVTSGGLAVTTFRLASTQRRYDDIAHEWVNSGTNWYTVACYRDLAVNVISSIERGHCVIVTGGVHIREWDEGDRTGVSVELVAKTIGHDLSTGTAVFTRSSRPTAHVAVA